MSNFSRAQLPVDNGLHSFAFTIVHLRYAVKDVPFVFEVEVGS